MTLIFVSAVVGNYSSYENYRRQHTSITGQAAGTWYYDVNKASALSFSWPACSVPLSDNADPPESDILKRLL